MNHLPKRRRRQEPRPFLCHFVDDVSSVQSNAIRKMSIDPREVLVEKLRFVSPNEKLSDKTVLMLTSRSDKETNLVAAHLLASGIDYLRLNIEDVPARILVRYTLDYDKRAAIQIGKRKVDLDDISAVWLRNFETRAINSSNNNLSQEFSMQQWDDAFIIMQNILRSRKWINTPKAMNKAADRLHQLTVARECGFQIPKTVITNDPEFAREFYYSNNRRVILKALHHHGVQLGSKIYSMYAHNVVRSDMPLFKNLVHAPCVLQEKLTKKSDVRITVVGKQIFAVEIDSQSSRNGRDDLHRSRLSQLPKKVMELDSSVTRICFKLMRSLELQFAGLDFVMDKISGNLVFLEVNPTGDWLWIERQTRLPITKAVADLLASSCSIH